MKNPTLVALLHGPDQPGLVARVAGWIFARGGNILHADQHRDMEEGVFFQRVEWVPVRAASAGHEAEEFLAFAASLGMQARLTHTARLPRVKALVLAGSLMGGEIEVAVREVRAQGLMVVSLNMAGSVPDAADLVVTDPVQAGVMTVMAEAKAKGVDPVLHYSASGVMNHEPLLGLPFPGGPYIDAAAREGDRDAIAAMQHVSFSATPKVQAALKERLEAAGVEVLGPVRTSPGSTSIYFPGFDVTASGMSSNKLKNPIVIKGLLRTSWSMA